MMGKDFENPFGLTTPKEYQNDVCFFLGCCFQVTKEDLNAYYCQKQLLLVKRYKMNSLPLQSTKMAEAFARGYDMFQEIFRNSHDVIDLRNKGFQKKLKMH
jgi:hypothetical protein